MIRSFAKRLPPLVLLLTALSASADPHFVQVLHPYWGHDERFNEYLSEFSGPVSVDVDEFNSSYEPDWFIYIYIVNAERAKELKVSIACPIDAAPSDQETTPAHHRILGADPIRENPEPVITEDHQVSWSLNPGAERQGMWVYSRNPPTERKYRLATIPASEDKEVEYQSGTLKGPSCSKKSSEDS